MSDNFIKAADLLGVRIQAGKVGMAVVHWGKNIVCRGVRWGCWCWVRRMYQLVIYTGSTGITPLIILGLLICCAHYRITYMIQFWRILRLHWLMVFFNYTNLHLCSIQPYDDDLVGWMKMEKKVPSSKLQLL